MIKSDTSCQCLILALWIVEGLSYELCPSASCCVLWCHQELLKASPVLRTSREPPAPGNTTQCCKPGWSEDVCQGWGLQLPWLGMALWASWLLRPGAWMGSSWGCWWVTQCSSGPLISLSCEYGDPCLSLSVPCALGCLMGHFKSQVTYIRAALCYRIGVTLLQVNSNNLPFALPQSQELQPECKDNNFPACVSSPGHLVLCISHPIKYGTSLTTTPTEETAPPPFAALSVLPALGICLQRACINTPCCLRLSRLIDSFNTSVALPAVVIIQQSWLSANSSTELALQLPVYYSKTSGERSGDSQMPIRLWAACELPRGMWRAKPWVWAVLLGWWLTASDIGLK